MTEKDKKFMCIAIDLSIQSAQGKGGPFGAVIVKDGKIIAQASNSVTLTNDPTAHAEVNAIRAAGTVLKNFNLSGCVIYTSCEPCPMCLGAIYCARMNKVFYANTRIDAQKIGFDDSFIFDEVAKPIEKRSLPMVQLMQKEAFKAFDAWMQNDKRIDY